MPRCNENAVVLTEISPANAYLLASATMRFRNAKDARTFAALDHTMAFVAGEAETVTGTAGATTSNVPTARRWPTFTSSKSLSVIGGAGLVAGSCLRSQIRVTSPTTGGTWNGVPRASHATERQLGDHHCSLSRPREFACHDSAGSVCRGSAQGCRDPRSTALRPG